MCWGYDNNKKLTKILVLIEFTVQWWKVSPKLTNIKYIVFQMMRHAEEKVKEEMGDGETGGTHLMDSQGRL